MQGILLEEERSSRGCAVQKIGVQQDCTKIISGSGQTQITPVNPAPANIVYVVLKDVIVGSTTAVSPTNHEEGVSIGHR